MKVDSGKNYTLYNGDNLDIIDILIEQGVKVDLILTDPPYNLSQDNNFNTMGRTGIDFGEWDKGADLITWIEKYSQILRDGGAVVIFNSWRNLGDIANKLVELGFEVKDMIAWIKGNAMPRNRDRRLVQNMEVCVYAVKGKDWTFNRQSENYDVPQIYVNTNNSNEREVGKYKFNSREDTYGIGNNLDKIIGEVGEGDLDFRHPTQKPVEVMDWFVKRFSNEGDLIIDPFNGSGSTGESALRLGRKYIGVEIDERYFKLSSNRLKKVEWVIEQEQVVDFSEL